MFSWTKRSKRSFHAENLKRQQKPYIAPGRGWYHIYTFRLGRPEEVSLDWLPDYPGETLALVRLDIRDYASRELDTLALDFAEQIFRAFQERKKEMILRVCYDTEGKGMEREPQRIFVVQRHMQALGSLAERYADAILTVQGVFVGSWGEMHTSRFLRPDQICLLAQTWQEATHHALTLSVRKPEISRCADWDYTMMPCLPEPTICGRSGMCRGRRQIGKNRGVRQMSRLI